MKLILKTEFACLRDNDNHHYDVDKNGDKEVLKIYFKDKLIAKRVTFKKSIRFFGVSGYSDYL